MARPEAVALGGYYPCPVELLASLASLVHIDYRRPDLLLLADPCAGTGQAVMSLAERWGRGASGQPDEDRWYRRMRIHTCELEEGRARACTMRLRDASGLSASHVCAQGDAFRLVCNPGERVHVLWHNPPYDIDRVHGRLEERWLRRFAPLLAVGGALLHFVPVYALAASAATIARHFSDVACFRVPAPHFEGFKQVVLVGRKRMELATPEPNIEAQVRAWSADAASIPELPIEGLPAPLLTVTVDETITAPTWKIGEIDVLGALAHYAPWTVTDRSGRRTTVPNVEPEDPYCEIMAPRLRLACAPRPAHIAMAAGVGVLSGARLRPDAEQRGPELLLKGVHRRVYRHLRWKEVKGERVAEERQHHPELQLSILNLQTGRYRTLASSMDPSGHADSAEWTVGDLLARYSGSMLDAMRARCELLYDRTRAADTARDLWPISPDPLVGGQEDGVRGILRLFAEPDRAAILLGEIGVGKSRMSLTAAAYHLGGRGKILVLCPTALLPEWQSEVAKVLPDATVCFLESVDDVDRFAALPVTAIHVAVLSKEPAKLGHAWRGVPLCPGCGVRSPETTDKLAESRARCPTVRARPVNEAARILARLAVLGARFPDAQLRDVVRRVGGRVLRQAMARGRSEDWRALEGVVRSAVTPLRRLLARSHSYETQNNLSYAYWSLLHAIGDDDLIVSEARALFRSTLTDRSGYDHGHAPDMAKIAAKTLLLLPPSSPWIATLIADFESYEGIDYAHKPVRLFRGRDVVTANTWRRRGQKLDGQAMYAFASFTAEADAPTYGGRTRGSKEALSFAIERLATLAAWGEDTCDEPLYQADPKPRRVPLAQYLLQRHPTLFDLLIIDEAHCYAHGDSAQSRAAQQLLSLRMRRRIPVIALTGTVMNGYARSLFVLLWHLSSRFRAEFSYGKAAEFEKRYGFLVQVVEHVDEKKQRVAFGTHSDRVTTRTRTTGAAPGVLPSAILRFLLPMAITVQLADLEHALPPCREAIVSVQATKAQRAAAEYLQTKLLTAIAKDRFQSGLAGKLFGALGHLPRYHDHATDDAGNRPDGSWTIAYPDDAPIFDKVVAAQPGLDRATRLPKETKLLELLRERLAAGKNIVVATVRTAIAQRLGRLIEADLGIRPAVLDAKKVSAKERRAWVVNAKEQGARVLLCNPAALPVGLNVLVGHFAVVVMFDDPNNDPTLLRQFRGRFVRIGQTDEVELLMLVYGSTLQEDANDLLQKKRVIAEASDGLDASAAFEVAGVGESASFESDLGKALYAKLTDRT